MELRTYIAFLRGINVSGQKKVSMEFLRTLSEDLGFFAVKTYIQTGNIVFQSPFKETVQLGLMLKDGIQREFGYDVPILYTRKNG